MNRNANTLATSSDQQAASNGTGSGAKIYIRYSYLGGKPKVLAHELVHAMRIMLGRRATGSVNGLTNQEEVEGQAAENVIAVELGDTNLRTVMGTPTDLTFWTDFSAI